MQSKATTFPKFISELPSDKRVVVRALDRMVRAAVPAAKCVMKFGMPVYEVGDRFIAINAQKNYFSFYADSSALKLYRDELKGLDCGKCCIRFKKIDVVPMPTLRKIAQAVLKR
jgi:uncharacterized protein YdhG (YjbR/CyaY superfamily)